MVVITTVAAPYLNIVLPSEYSSPYNTAIEANDAGTMYAKAPAMSQSYYHDDWAKDSEKTEIDNDNLYMFKKYGLSKREIEVCKLLLQGYTLRQISGILSIAYSTVNTYCTSSYRKLNINSRTELLLMFKDNGIGNS